MSSQLLLQLIRLTNARTERGAAMVEYALLVALIAIVAIVALQALGSNVSENFDTINSTIEN